MLNPASFGQHLLGPQLPINPFQAQNVPAPAPMNETPYGGSVAPSPPQAPPPEQQTERLAGWRTFIGRLKTDPNMKMAMFQTLLGMTQPAGSPAEAVGSSLQRGVQTLEALNQQQRDQARQGRMDQLDERKVGVSERQVGVAEGGLAEDRRRGDLQERQITNQEDQFGQNLSQEQKELSARLEQIRGDNEYKRAQVEIERAKLAQGGEQGQVNQRWTRLSNLLLRTRPELFEQFGDQANDYAQAYAWDLMNGEQDRSTLKAKLMNDQLIFDKTLAPGSKATPEQRQQALQALSTNIDTLLDSAGIGEGRIFRTPAAPTPAPQPGAANRGPVGGQILRPGTSLTVNSGGKPVNGIIRSVGTDTVVVEFEGLGTRTLKRSMLEGNNGP